MSRALVVGAGGLGCPAAWGLAGTVSTLGLVDDERVELSNLNRQILHRTSDLGRLKVESARDALRRRFSALEVICYPVRLDETSVARLIAGWEVVVDGSDSFATKFLLNDACVAAGIPLVHGAAVGFGGQLMSVLPDSACYRCLFEAPPGDEVGATCQEAGILGAAAGVIGGLQASEAGAIIRGNAELAGTLLVFDGRSGGRRRVSIRRRPDCQAHRREAV